MYKKKTPKEKRDIVKNNANEERVESQKKHFKINRTPSMPVNKCDNCRCSCCLFMANNGRGYCLSCASYFVNEDKAEWNGEK